MKSSKSEIGRLTFPHPGPPRTQITGRPALVRGVLSIFFLSKAYRIEHMVNWLTTKRPLIPKKIKTKMGSPHGLLGTLTMTFKEGYRPISESYGGDIGYLKISKILLLKYFYVILVNSVAVEKRP